MATRNSILPVSGETPATDRDRRDELDEILRKAHSIADAVYMLDQKLNMGRDASLKPNTLPELLDQQMLLLAHAEELVDELAHSEIVDLRSEVRSLEEKRVELNAAIGERDAEIASLLAATPTQAVNRRMWQRLQEFERQNAKRPTAEVMRELERGQWGVYDRGYDEVLQDRYLTQHTWSRKGLNAALAREQLLASIWQDDEDEAA